MNLVEFSRMFECSVPEILERLRNGKRDFWRWWWTQFASEQVGIHNGDLRRTMSHFGKVVEGIDVAPFLQEIEAKPGNWFVNTKRKGIGVQQHTDSISLRQAAFRSVPGMDPIDTTRDVQESGWTELATQYPRLVQFLQRFAAAHGKGSLARVMIVRLAPKKDVGRHWDCGYYYLCRDRYHLVLRTSGSKMECGGIRCVWNAGELWWFNNNLWHSASHDADDWRIHIIFDVLPDRNKPVVEEFKRHTEYYQAQALAQAGSSS
jgi:hypothetical protein